MLFFVFLIVELLDHPESQITVSLFESIVFSCSAAAIDIDSFFFTFDGQILTDDNNTNITVQGEPGRDMPAVGFILIEDDNTSIAVDDGITEQEEPAGSVPVVVVTVSIYNVTEEDVGEYSCIVSNAVSSENATFSLEISPSKST